MEAKTTYFDKPGGENTDKTLALAKARADELGIKTAVVASTVGKTAVKTVDVFKGYKVIVVTHVAGFREPNSQEFTDENRKIVEGKGGIILTTTHAFGGIHRALGRGDAPPASTAGYRRYYRHDAADIRTGHQGSPGNRRHGGGRRTVAHR